MKILETPQQGDPERIAREKRLQEIGAEEQRVQGEIAELEKKIAKENLRSARESAQASRRSFFGILGAPTDREQSSELIPKNKIGQDQTVPTMGRRGFIKLTGVSLVAGALTEILQKLETKRPLNLLEIHQDSPNKERICGAASGIMKLRPGGYRGSLESTDIADINVRGNEAYSQNFRGTDERSIWELAILEKLLEDDKRFLNISDSLKIHMQSNYGEGALGVQDFIYPERAPALSAGDLLLLLQVLGSRYAREKALECLYTLQQTDNLKSYGLEPLSGEKILWAGKNGIEPWNLAWAEAMKPLAEIMLVASPEIWFDGLTSQEQKTRIESIIKNGISNPGAIAMLEHTETKDMTYVGDVPFITQINSGPRYYPTAEHDMQRVAGYLEDSWGLPYRETFEQEGQIYKTYQYTPGSLRGRKNASGGAVFGQFMPINLLLFTEKYEQTRNKLKEKNINLPPLLPGSPWGMSLLKYLYLNGEWKAVHGKAPFKHVKLESTKGGYVVGDEDRIRKSLRSWNPHPQQIQTVFNAAMDYYRAFEVQKQKPD